MRICNIMLLLRSTRTCRMIIVILYTCSWKRKVFLVLLILALLLAFCGDSILKNVHDDNDPLEMSNSFIHKHIFNEENINKTQIDTHTKVQKIFLVSSSPRTGSSYTASLLTAMPNSSYYFEPFWINKKSNNMLKVSKLHRLFMRKSL